jgi:hypothetical protein
MNSVQTKPLDRAVATDYVALSSTLLFVWALGSAVGPRGRTDQI